ncbi:Histone H2A.Z-specific chaperone [Ciborinia camelliae]|nr:Histone H2A.Z-specific chaperone [Ciborinia camelliae]
MSAQNVSATNITADKGKGKSVAEPQDVTMGEGEDSSSEEEVDDDAPPPAEEVEEETSDNEIDKSNIIQGRRTRGKQIDFAAAAKDLPAEDDEDEDDDFRSEGEGEDDDEMGGN